MLGDSTLKTPTTGVFEKFDQAVAFLKGGGWSGSGFDVMTYFRATAKARIQRTPRGYRVVYSKKRMK
jgi:hypothetical protein